MDPNFVSKALQETLSGDNERIKNGENALLSSRTNPNLVKALLVIANDEKVSEKMLLTS